MQAVHYCYNSIKVLRGEIKNISQPSSVQIRLVRRFRNEDDILPFVDYFKDTDRNKVNGLQGIPCLIYLY